MAASPKVGKTELLTALTARWTKEKVLWLTEESVEVWGERVQVRAEIVGKHIDLAFAFGEDADDMQDLIYTSDATVIVIDTIRMLGIEDENNNAVVARALTPYIKLCRERGQTLILVHHTRKTEGEYGAAISGGHAYAGIVDVLVEISRTKNGPDNRRKVQSLGRIASAPDILYEWREDTKELVVLGGAKELGKYPSLGSVLAKLDRNWRTSEEIRDKLPSPKLSKSTVLRNLAKLVDEGLAERDPKEETPRTTYRWRKTKTE